LLLFQSGAVVDAVQENDAWQQLQHKTAWVFLGVLDPTDDLWTTQVHYQLVNAESRHPTAVPRIDDVLEVSDDDGLLTFTILDFATRGEERRLDSPAATGDRVPTNDDNVGVKLKKGTRLRVVDVQLQVSRSTSGRVVWLRVVPA
jgi:hypothetical protein